MLQHLDSFAVDVLKTIQATQWSLCSSNKIPFPTCDVIVSFKNTLPLDHSECGKQSDSLTICWGLFPPSQRNTSLRYCVLCCLFLFCILSSSTPVLSLFRREGSRATAGVVFTIRRAKTQFFKLDIYCDVGTVSSGRLDHVNFGVSF